MRSLEIMLNELLSHRLTVILIPQKRFTNEGGMIRVAIDKSPRWYSKFCDAHPSSRKRNHRKPDTRIRRADVISLLTRMAEGVAVRSKYAPELRRIAHEIEK